GRPAGDAGIAMRLTIIAATGGTRVSTRLPRFFAAYSTIRSASAPKVRRGARYSLLPFRNNRDTYRLDTHDRRVVKVPAADARRPYVSSLIPRAASFDGHVRHCRSRSSRVTPVTRRRPRPPTEPHGGVAVE